MKFILFSGTHPRHLYVHEQLIEQFNIGGIVCMQREEMVPEPDSQWPERDKELFRHHFQRREEVESETYGGRSATDLYDSVDSPVRYVSEDKLNSEEVREFVASVDPDVCFIYGGGIIREPVFSELPEWRFDFHPGYLPKYKGSASLFWPFYFLEPQYCVGTLFRIEKNVDGGEIIHHAKPELGYGQGIHEVAANTVVKFAADTKALLRHLTETESLPTYDQTASGKVFLSDDFKPPHLRLIYDYYDNRIVDEWLDGALGDDEPDLIDTVADLGLDVDVTLPYPGEQR